MDILYNIIYMDIWGEGYIYIYYIWIYGDIYIYIYIYKEIYMDIWILYIYG